MNFKHIVALFCFISISASHAMAQPTEQKRSLVDSKKVGKKLMALKLSQKIVPIYNVQSNPIRCDLVEGITQAFECDVNSRFELLHAEPS
jgi:hypothetical protein